MRKFTDEYKSSTTVAFSFSVSISTRDKTSSHLPLDASCTVSQSQSGTSSSALEQAWSALIILMPNRASTVDELKDSSAPA